MKINKFSDQKDQIASCGAHSWSVARLCELSRNFPVVLVPLDYLNIYHKYDGLTLRDMVMHINAVNDADLSYPIILDEDGEIMDGRHRIMKALMVGAKKIKVVRFDENPTPCRIEE